MKQLRTEDILKKNKIYRDSLDSTIVSNDQLYIRSLSTKSLGFRINSSNVGLCAEQLFNIFFAKANVSNETKQRFITKFKEAVNGSGKEIKKINALHSSSLCAFLFFFDVSEEKPIYIDGIKYDEVYFEVQNTAIEGRAPSNMDVVLISSKSNEILFIECKFSEYISNQAQMVSREYFNNTLSKELYESVKDLYNKLPCKDDDYEKIKFKDAYSQGIKQIISHILGMTSYIENGQSFDQRLKKIYPTIKFRELLFSLKGYEKKLNGYLELSKIALNRFKSIIKDEIKLYDAMTYKELYEQNEAYFKNKELIKQFYRLEE